MISVDTARAIFERKHFDVAASDLHLLDVDTRGATRQYWDLLNMLSMRRREIIGMYEAGWSEGSLKRSGIGDIYIMTCRNAFNVGNRLLLEFAGGVVDSSPLWLPHDIRSRGNTEENY